MAITREAIINKEFKKSMRGFDCLEVDKFLDELANEIAALNQRIQEQQEELNRYKAMESSLSSSIIFAKESAEKMISDATSEAEKILSDAKAESEAMVEAANREAAETAARMYKLSDSIMEEAAENVKKIELESEETISALKKDISALDDYITKYRDSITDMFDKQKDAFLAGVPMPSMPELSSGTAAFDMKEVYAETATPEELRDMINEMI